MTEKRGLGWRFVAKADDTDAPKHRRTIDALEYAKGFIVQRINEHDEVTWTLDARDIVDCFARRCALDVIHLWRPRTAVETYLKTGDEALCKDLYAIRPAPFFSGLFEPAANAAFYAIDARHFADAAFASAAFSRDALLEKRNAQKRMHVNDAAAFVERAKVRQSVRLTRMIQMRRQAIVRGKAHEHA